MDYSSLFPVFPFLRLSSNVTKAFFQSQHRIIHVWLFLIHNVYVWQDRIFSYLNSNNHLRTDVINDRFQYITLLMYVISMKKIYRINSSLFSARRYILRIYTYFSILFHSFLLFFLSFSWFITFLLWYSFSVPHVFIIFVSFQVVN